MHVLITECLQATCVNEAGYHDKNWEVKEHKREILGFPGKIQWQ